MAQQKSVLQLHAEKLEKADKLFKKVEEYLVKQQPIPPQEKELYELALLAKNYSTGRKDSMYNSCVRLYQMFNAQRNKYNALKGDLKVYLRRIAKYYQDFRENPAETTFPPIQLPLFEKTA
jgi:hypothetical protein